MMIPVLVMWILITGNVQYSCKLYRGGHWVLPNTAVLKEQLANTKILCLKSPKY